MDNTQKKQIVTFLNHSAAAKLLSGSPQKSEITLKARSLYNQMRAKYSENDIAGVDLIERILSEFIWMMVKCEDPSQLERTMEYIESLNKGKVIIAQEDNTLLTQQGHQYAPESASN